MDTQTLIRRAVTDGLASIEAADYDDWTKDACRRGFRRCLELVTVLEFQEELARCERSLAELRRDKSAKHLYWSHRWYMLQIEHVYKLLCAAWHLNKLPGYRDLPAPYARSMMQYAKIVGVRSLQAERG